MQAIVHVAEMEKAHATKRAFGVRGRLLHKESRIISAVPQNVPDRSFLPSFSYTAPLSYTALPLLATKRRSLLCSISRVRWCVPKTKLAQPIYQASDNGQYEAFRFASEVDRM